jgi:hypothetical protein
MGIINQGRITEILAVAKEVRQEYLPEWAGHQWVVQDLCHEAVHQEEHLVAEAVRVEVAVVISVEDVKIKNLQEINLADFCCL